MGRGESGIRQELRPLLADPDKIIAISPIAMEEDNELAGLAGMGGQARSIEKGHIRSVVALADSSVQPAGKGLSIS
jgi:hypothetical protein